MILSACLQYPVQCSDSSRLPNAWVRATVNDADSIFLA